MRLSSLLRIFSSLIFGGVLVLSARAEFEESALNSVINTLDHFMRAGVDRDPSRGAELLQTYERDAHRAEYDTRRLYQKQKDLLQSYVSISSDIYGYEVENGMMGTSVELEGGIETRDGLTAEFKARVVYVRKRWLIADIEID